MIHWGIHRQKSDIGPVDLVAICYDTGATAQVTRINVNDKKLAVRLKTRPRLSDRELDRMKWLRSVFPQETVCDILAAWSFAVTMDLLAILKGEPEWTANDQNQEQHCPPAVKKLRILKETELACVQVGVCGEKTTVLLLEGVEFTDQNNSSVTINPFTKLRAPNALLKSLDAGTVFRAGGEIGASGQYTVDLETGVVKHDSGLVVKFQKNDATHALYCQPLSLPPGVNEQEKNRIVREAADAFHHAWRMRN